LDGIHLESAGMVVYPEEKKAAGQGPAAFYKLKLWTKKS
jgi:hypothetical protein